MKSIATAALTVLVLSCSLGHRVVAWTTPSTAAVACGRASGSLSFWFRQSRLHHKRNKFVAGDRCLRASAGTSASYSNRQSSSVPLSIVLSPAGDWTPRGQPRSVRRQLPAGRRQSLLHATTGTSTATGVESEDDGRIEIAGACASCGTSPLQQPHCSAAVQRYSNYHGSR